MSSSVPILIPADAWDGEPDEGVLSNWFYADGAQVEQGALLAEYMVEKSEMELEAPASGTLRILVAAEGTIERGSKVGEIEQDG